MEAEKIASRMVTRIVRVGSLSCRRRDRSGRDACLNHEYFTTTSRTERKQGRETIKNSVKHSWMMYAA
jgi:hypothetical protein